MITSENTSTIYKALFDLNIKAPKIIKSKSNDFLKSKYADLADVKDAIFEAMNELGLLAIQTPNGEYGLTTRIVHIQSGEFIEDSFIIKPQQVNPQQAGAVITYQRRYALVSMLGLVTDDDDDADTSSRPLKSKTDEASIERCKTLEELQKLWEANTEWHNNNEYIKRVKAKKLQLSK